MERIKDISIQILQHGRSGVNVHKYNVKFRVDRLRKDANRISELNTLLCQRKSSPLYTKSL